MNVKHLKQFLKNLPDDMKVILARDEEGNGFLPLYQAVSDFVYHDGDIYDIYWTAKEAGMTEEKWKEMVSKSKCLVLWP